MRALAALLGAAIVLSVAACGGGENTPESQSYKQIDRHARSRTPYIPRNDVEFKNYNRAQQLYDSPTTIIWCSTTWGNTAAPIITIPVAGKLTSSTTTFFSPERAVDRGNYSWQVLQARSVDGLYHPNPPQYRYGFTPGGQYVDFFNMPTVCTTALTKFQRQQTDLRLSVDGPARAAQQRAEAALRRGDKKQAARELEAIQNG